MIESKKQNTKNLQATLQNSYYGKAKIIEDGDIIYLKSYDTIVCSYNTKIKTFTKLWGGYSRTTAKHIEDFIKQYNINFNFNKKNWLAYNDESKKQKYYIEYTNGFFNANTKKTLIFDNYEDAEKYAEKLQAGGRLWAFVEYLDE